MKLVARAAVSKDLTGAGGSASKAFTWLQIDMLLLATQSLFVCVESVSHSESLSTGLLDMAAGSLRLNDQNATLSLMTWSQNHTLSLLPYSVH